MPFPETERVIYKKNPLDKVICQLRYPPILKIDSEVPAEFQENIRADFPFYKENFEIQQEITVGIRRQLAPEILNQSKKSEMSKNHEFTSQDNIWKINLTRTFLSISASKYRRWEDFFEMFKPSIRALQKVYAPPFFTRIGLRYIDIFDREKLGIPEMNWTELLKPHFLGLLSSEVGPKIKHFENIYEVNLADNSSVVRIAALFVMNRKSKDKCYKVDSDFYCPKRTNLSDYEDKLEFLHKRATRLIRWIITDKLHKTMEPKEI